MPLTSSNRSVSLTLAEISARVNAEFSGAPETLITGAAPIGSAGPGDISFVANKSYQKHISNTGASALVLDKTVECTHIPVLRHDNPYLIFAHIVDLLYPIERFVPSGVSSGAIVDSEAKLSPSAGIGPLCHIGKGSVVGSDCQLVSSVFVGEDVTLGDNCLIYPGVRILNGTQIGKNAIIHAGVVIGSDGFGFARSDTGMKKIQQVGWVEIGDDVEIGANTTVDRGALGATRIGSGTKIDNLVQIAHNVEIGRHCIMAAQVGISGSTKIGDGVVFGGQVGVVGHIEVGDDVQVGAQSGVATSVEAGKKIFGSPARDIMLTQRIEASLRRLPELLKRVKKLEDDR